MNIIIWNFFFFFRNNQLELLYSKNISDKSRSSHQRCSMKKGVLRNFTKFTRKNLSRVSFLIKLQASGLKPATFLEKRLWHRCFPVNFVQFLRTPFLQNTSDDCFYRSCKIQRTTPVIEPFSMSVSLSVICTFRTNLFGLLLCLHFLIKPFFC